MLNVQIHSPFVARVRDTRRRACRIVAAVLLFCIIIRLPMYCELRLRTSNDGAHYELVERQDWAQSITYNAVYYLVIGKA